MLARDSLKKHCPCILILKWHEDMRNVRARDEECGPWAEGLLRGGGPAHPSSQTAGSPKDEEKTCTLVQRKHLIPCSGVSTVAFRSLAFIKHPGNAFEDLLIWGKPAIRDK